MSLQQCLKTVKIVFRRIRRGRALKTDGDAAVNDLSPRVFLLEDVCTLFLGKVIRCGRKGGGGRVGIG